MNLPQHFIGRFSFYPFPLRIFAGLFFTFSFLIAEAQLPAGFIREPMAEGLNPTSMTVAPDGRIFITEKHGQIRIVRDGELLEESFLEIEVDDSNERGLGHMVLHPDFELNNYYYVFYSVPGMRQNRISRFTANGDHTIPGSEFVLLDLDHLGTDIHNGGDMIFGFDGFLYVSTGEGGVNWQAGDLTTTNGKILRMDDAGNPVSENPWYDLVEGRAQYVYAYGLRNPFTMAIHPITGEIFANDVGGNLYEEINKIEPGAYYGWPVLEGKRTNQIVPNEYRDPVYAYSHYNHYCAVVGGTFYEPAVPQFPEQYIGRYFYSDYCTGQIRTLDVSTGQDKGTFISDGNRVVDLDVTNTGSLLYLERRGLGDGSPEDNTGSEDGMLWKVTYTGSGKPFISVQPESVLRTESEDARFSVIASGAIPLKYTWYADGIEIPEIDSSVLLFSNVTLSQDSTTVEVRVSNGEGDVLSEQVLLRVTDNHRPVPEILLPDANTLYKGGDTIRFSGEAFDTDEGMLSADGLSWKIDFHHGTHSHPGLSWTPGIASGEWIIPSLGETSADVWYRIYLRATDAEGLTKVVYRDIYPALGSFRVKTKPSGLVMQLDGTGKATPFDVEGVQHIQRYVSAPDKQIRGDSVFFFDQWEDGTKLSNRPVETIETDQTFTATFKGQRKGRGYGLTASYYDNKELMGDPIAVAIDSIIDHQFHLGAPYPGLPEEGFGILWEGYLQSYRSGWYQLTVFADDGIYIAVNQEVLIDNLTGGAHHESASVYLEGGKLHPIRIKFYDEAWGSHIQLRWSSARFAEEVIPSAQLYPADYFAGQTAPDELVIENLTKNVLVVAMLSQQEVEYQMQIISVNGRVLAERDVPFAIGKNLIDFDVQSLPPGMYYLRCEASSTGAQSTLPFVKVDY